MIQGQAVLRISVILIRAVSPKIVCVCFDLRGKEGIEIDLGIVGVDLAGQKDLSVQAQDTVRDGGIGMDIGGQPAGKRFLAVEEPFVGGNTDVDGLYDLVIGEKLGRMVAGLIINIGECMAVLMDTHPPVPVPGLLDEKAVAVEAVDIIGKDHGVGNGVQRGLTNGEVALRPLSLPTG